MRFTVDGPGPLSVEVNGQIRPALLLFIDPPEESPPPPDASKVRRFAGGQLHEAGEIRLADDQTLYLELGAVVRGTVQIVVLYDHGRPDLRSLTGHEGDRQENRVAATNSKAGGHRNWTAPLSGRESA